MKILFLAKKSDFYSNNLLKFLKKKSKSLDVILSDGKKNILKKKIIKKYDYIISFRSHFMLKQKHINLAQKAAINFHPGPPKYRGIGCINLAILRGEKKYGTTVHLINKKIDNGKIIDIKYFNLKKTGNLETNLIKTHNQMLSQSKNILDKIFKNPNYLNFLINKNKNIKWSKELMTRKKLDKLYEINKNISKAGLIRAIKALKYKNFIPYIKIQNVKFMLN